jgi:glyoxylase-like metal-dependent hydrolase (beta-lactamase superfamily II)
VTLGAINWTHGLILIDAPFRPDDIRSWRAALLNFSGGVDRLLVNLDAHFDRTLGVRAMESTVVAHEKAAAVFRNRPSAFKTQGNETGAEWELYNGLGSIRWAAPDLTFSQQLSIHWNEHPLVLEYHPGPASGAIWAVLPEQRIVFLGDAVTVGQPPFLAWADLPAWIENLRVLLEPPYRDYLLVSGRGGLVTQEQARQQLGYLENLHNQLEELFENKATPEDARAVARELAKGFDGVELLQEHYRQRLGWGLHQYYARHYRMLSVEEE